MQIHHMTQMFAIEQTEGTTTPPTGATGQTKKTLRLESGGGY